MHFNSFIVSFEEDVKLCPYGSTKLHATLPPSILAVKAFDLCVVNQPDTPRLRNVDSTSQHLLRSE